MKSSKFSLLPLTVIICFVVRLSVGADSQQQQQQQITMRHELDAITSGGGGSSMSSSKVVSRQFAGRERLEAFNRQFLKNLQAKAESNEEEEGFVEVDDDNDKYDSADTIKTLSAGASSSVKVGQNFLQTNAQYFNPITGSLVSAQEIKSQQAKLAAQMQDRKRSKSSQDFQMSNPRRMNNTLRARRNRLLADPSFLSQNSNLSKFIMNKNVNDHMLMAKQQQQAEMIKMQEAQKKLLEEQQKMLMRRQFVNMFGNGGAGAGQNGLNNMNNMNMNYDIGNLLGGLNYNSYGNGYSNNNNFKTAYDYNYDDDDSSYRRQKQSRRRGQRGGIRSSKNRKMSSESKKSNSKIDEYSSPSFIDLEEERILGPPSANNKNKHQNSNRKLKNYKQSDFPLLTAADVGGHDDIIESSNKSSVSEGANNVEDKESAKSQEKTVDLMVEKKKTTTSPSRNISKMSNGASGSGIGSDSSGRRQRRIQYCVDRLEDVDPADRAFVRRTFKDESSVQTPLSAASESQTKNRQQKETESGLERAPLEEEDPFARLSRIYDQRQLENRQRKQQHQKHNARPSMLSASRKSTRTSDSISDAQQTIKEAYDTDTKMLMDEDEEEEEENSNEKVVSLSARRKGPTKKTNRRERQKHRRQKQLSEWRTQYVSTKPLSASSTSQTQEKKNSDTSRPLNFVYDNEESINNEKLRSAMMQMFDRPSSNRDFHDPRNYQLRF